MDIRYAVHPDQMKLLDTEALRKHFLVEGLFERNKVNMVYSHVDRIIVGGACPADQEVELKVTKELGVDFFLQRREMGIINIGSKGMVSVDGKEHVLESRECLYIGMGSKDVTFKSSDGNQSGKILFQQCPCPRGLSPGETFDERCSTPPSGCSGKEPMSERSISLFIPMC